jgi:GNAT superfamily N-acetyltransferase
MYAALELVNEYNGKSVSLQVRADNQWARHLYNSLKFKELAGTTFLRLNQVPAVEEVSVPPGLKLRPRHFSALDGRLAYNLARAATPEHVQGEWPLRRSRFELGVNEQVSNLFHRLVGAAPAAYWAVEESQRLVGLVNVLGGVFGQPHRLELVVHPDWRGTLERPLLNHALHYLYPWRHKEMVVKHPADHLEAIAAFKEFGFNEEQTLIWMKREM